MELALEGALPSGYPNLERVTGKRKRLDEDTV